MARELDDELPGGITSTHVRALAKLACIELTEDECTRLRSDLERIVALAESLSSTEGATTPEVLDAGPDRLECLRADVPVPSLDREAVLAAASRTVDGYFEVPGFVDEG